MRYKLLITYDGSKYKGWQVQPHGNSIQQHLENVIRMKFQREVKIASSGRTDTGVHALGQVAHFDFDIDVDPIKLQEALNKSINKDIHILSVEKVSDEFHSRFDAKSKTYKYEVNLGEYDALKANHQLQLCIEIDFDKVNSSMKKFIGEHDFASFSGDVREDTVRTVYSFEMIKNKNNTITFVVNGNGFLTHMVRHLVGTLIAIGTNKVDLNYIDEMFKVNKKGANMYKAPGEGLYLVEVNYK